jgi:dephospho-CoA kinase
MLVGLTGGIGSGKTTILGIFARLGCPVFSADDEVADLLWQPEVQAEVREAFGLTVFKDGVLDKRALASLVFGGPGPLKRLEGILHPRVLERLRAFADAHAGEVAVAEIPLLFEKKLEGMFDATVCVYCSEDLAFRRYARSRSVTEEEARRRASWQLPLESKKHWAEYTLDTGGDPESVAPQVEALLEQLKAKLNG